VLGNYINKARLDYVGDLTTSGTAIVTTQPINRRYGFGGGFFGDYAVLREKWYTPMNLAP
jgi:hypothetical protein